MSRFSVRSTSLQRALRLSVLARVDRLQGIRTRFARAHAIDYSKLARAPTRTVLRDREHPAVADYGDQIWGLTAATPGGTHRDDRRNVRSSNVWARGVDQETPTTGRSADSRIVDALAPESALRHRGEQRRYG